MSQAIYKNLAYVKIKAVVTQSNVGGGDVGIRIRPGAASRLFVDWFGVGADDYGAARTVERIRMIDDSNDFLFDLIPVTTETLDNAKLIIPQAAAAYTRPEFGGIIPVMGTDAIHTVITALAQNETLTIEARGFLDGLPGGVSITDFGSTGTTTITVEEVEYL